MKKIFGVTIAVMLGLIMIGCEDTMEDTNTEQPETKQEQKVETKEQENTEKEEVVEEEPKEEVEVFDEKVLNRYMTTNLPDEEYKTYFESIEWAEGSNKRVIEFDGYIVTVFESEKYKTRSEIGLAAGDYDGNDVFNYQGITMMTRDIANDSIAGLTPGTNVKVKATIEEYDMDAGYLKIQIKEIEAR